MVEGEGEREQEQERKRMTRLVDAYGREIRSLRFSIMNRCNLNCIYCHAEGEEYSGGEPLSAELITAIARVASRYYNIRRVKFSGGEPLMRDDLPAIIQAIRAFMDDISLTTNGTLLSSRAGELADSGLDRVNISLDSLREDRYDAITRTRNNLSRVIDGIYSAIDAGLTPIKLNMVVLKGVNDDEIEDMIEFVRNCNDRAGGRSRGREVVILQLIELMPFFNPGMDIYRPDFDKLEAELRAKASAVKTRRLQRRRKYIVDGVEVEVVHPMDNTEFCANCTRLRITSEGKIKPCLLRNDNLVPIERVDDEHIISRLEMAMRYREPFFRRGPSKN